MKNVGVEVYRWSFTDEEGKLIGDASDMPLYTTRSMARRLKRSGERVSKVRVVVTPIEGRG